jgi:D-alanyl-D-alanine carboxypeptidase
MALEGGYLESILNTVVMESKRSSVFELVGIGLVLLIGLFLTFKNGNFKNDTSQNTDVFKVSLEQHTDASKIPGINAESYLLAVYDGNNLHTLKTFNAETPRRIASVTKLMTAIVAEEALPKTYILTLNKEALLTFGSSHFYSAGEQLGINDALNSLLVESNNDIARAFATSLPQGNFLQKMNEEAQRLGMKDTVYRNTSGLDGSSTSTTNFSTASDLSLLLRTYVDDHRALLARTTQKEAVIRFANNSVSHLATSTDHLLTDSTFPYTVLGGKTGETALAKKNLAIVATDPNEPLVYIGVVLYSDDHFSDMKKLFATLTTN